MGELEFYREISRFTLKGLKNDGRVLIMFIELTHKERELPVTINLRDIATILPLEDNTTRLSHISNGEYVDFIESYSRVKELIEHEVQAERGY